MGKNYKNIYLVAMSTLRSSYSETEFKFTEKGQEFRVKGAYQLEPVPNLLHEKGQCLDKVLLLVTDATEDLEKNEKAFSIKRGDNEEEFHKSPEGYYRDWLKERNKEKFGIEPDIESVLIDESKPAEGINKAVEKLDVWSQEYRNQDEKIRIILDTHGGFRSTQMISEAIIKIWKDSDIRMDVYNVYYKEKGNDKEKDKGNDKKEELDRIERDKAIDIFDFVSGINEFVKYGRADSLIEWARRNEKESEELISIISEIAVGIQWCNIQQFEKGLKRLNEYKEKIDKGELSSSWTYIQIFQNEIFSNYKDLLDSDQAHDPLQTIAWCCKRGFYQQALTILEAKMPERLFKEKSFLALTENGRQLKRDYMLYSGDLEFSDIFNGCIYLFNKEYKFQFWGSGNKFGSIFGQKYRFVNICNGISKMLTKNNRDLSQVTGLVEHCSIATFEKKGVCERPSDNIYENVLTIKGLEDEEICSWIACFIVMHITLKNIRNKSNHAAVMSNFDSNAIINALRFYIELAEKIEEKLNSIS